MDLNQEQEAIWTAIVVDSAIWDATVQRIARQDVERGGWPSPRDVEVPDPPWPARADPMLHFLLARALAAIESGVDVEYVLNDLAIHAWFEGGVENYDRGQREAQPPRLA